MVIRPKQTQGDFSSWGWGFWGWGFFFLFWFFFFSFLGLESDAQLVAAAVCLNSFSIFAHSRARWGICPCRDTSHSQQHLLQMLMKYLILLCLWKEFKSGARAVRFNSALLILRGHGRKHCGSWCVFVSAACGTPSAINTRWSAGGMESVFRTVLKIWVSAWQRWARRTSLPLPKHTSLSRTSWKKNVIWEGGFVSLPLVLEMVIEHILLEAVSGHMKEDVSGNDQHSFTKGKSCLTYVMVFKDRLVGLWMRGG